MVPVVPQADETAGRVEPERGGSGRPERRVADSTSVVGSITIERHEDGRWRANCYVVKSSDGAALIIDPGMAAADVAEGLSEDGSQIVGILCTHGHFDHVETAATVRNGTGAPLFIHSADHSLLRSASLYRKLFDGTGPVSTPEIDGFFDRSGAELRLGPFAVAVTHAPGHTEGSVFLQVEGAFFSGDTLLPRTVGRTDLPGGDAEALERTLARAARLPLGLPVFPGHGAPGTIGTMLEANARLRELRAATGEADARPDGP